MVKACQVPILNGLLTGSRCMPFTFVNLKALMRMVLQRTRAVMCRNLLTSLRFLTWTLGLTNNFTYKNFDLSIFFTGQLGQYVYSNTANAFFTAGSLANGRNTTKDIPTTTEDKLNAPDVSTRFLYDASFVRLQNVTLGYNFKPNSGVFQNLRIYLTGTNLAVFTDYPFQDPEVSVPKPVTLGKYASCCCCGY